MADRPKNDYERGIYNQGHAAGLRHQSEAVTDFFSTGKMTMHEHIFGKGTMGWSVYDDSTYDGEPLAMHKTPMEAIMEWHSDRVYAAEEAAASEDPRDHDDRDQ